MSRFTVNIFDFQRVAEYLNAVTGSGKRNGIRLRMAKYLRCHPTHISQIVKGKATLSAEFSLELNGFLGHTTAEAEYFQLLALRELAGTVSLADYYTKKIDALRTTREEVSGIIEDTRISDNGSWQYYADWSVAAVHVALTLPHVRTEAQLCRCLSLDLISVQRALGILIRLGLVEKEGDDRGQSEYSAVLNAAHLNSSDPAIALHHQTWRMKALSQIHKDPKSGIHYSAAASVSSEDLKALKALLLDTIRTFVEKVKASPPETMVAITMDLFNL